jgi:uncharacterized protein YcfJ
MNLAEEISRYLPGQRADGAGLGGAATGAVLGGVLGSLLGNNND